jgi:hypothetical protein
MASKATLGDYLFKATVTLLAGGSLLAGISVAISMGDRFALHRGGSKEAALEGAVETQQAAASDAKP